MLSNTSTNVTDQLSSRLETAPSSSTEPGLCRRIFVVFVLKRQRNVDYWLIVHTSFVYVCPSVVLY